MKSNRIYCIFLLLLIVPLIPSNAFAASDNKDPYVIESSIPDSKEVEISAGVTIIFNENIQKGSNYFKIVLQSKDKKAMATNISIKGKSLYINPKACLLYNTDYILTVPARGLKDSSGNELRKSYQISFRTMGRETSEQVIFTDKNIEKAVRTSCDKKTGILTKKDVASVYFINLDNKNINDISDLKKLVNLKRLYLTDNNITDILPLLKLTNLKYLSIEGNKIINASALFEVNPDFEVLSQYGIYWDRKNYTDLKKMEDKIQDILSRLTPDMSDLTKELIIHDYIVRNAHYDYDTYEKGSDTHIPYTAYGILVEGKGVCQGYAEATNILLNLSGIESIIVGGSANNGQWGGHAWNIVKIDGNYFHLDTTWDELPVKVISEYVEYDYFNLSDEEISINHKWNSESYPLCTTKDKFRHIIDDKKYGCKFDDTFKYLYYISTDVPDSIYRVSVQDALNGSARPEIIKDVGEFISKIKIHEKCIYIIYNYNCFAKIEIDSLKFTELFSKNKMSKLCLSDCLVKDGWIYINYEDIISRVKYDGSELQAVHTAPAGYTIHIDHIDGGWVYYTLMDKNYNYTDYKITTDGIQNTKI